MLPYAIGASGLRFGKLSVDKSTKFVVLVTQVWEEFPNLENMDKFFNLPCRRSTKLVNFQAYFVCSLNCSHHRMGTSRAEKICYLPK